MKKLFVTVLFIAPGLAIAQQSFYNVTAGNGNGIRFWNSDTYKVHMGNAAEYHYGPVTDYSIKMGMSNTNGRGWTWGALNSTPIAALNTQGQFQISGWLKTLSYETHGSSVTKTQIVEHSHSGSHALLFNAYKDINETGNLQKTGNTKYANNVGSYSGGAGAIMFFGNGGTMRFLISPPSTGKDTQIDWGTPKMVILRDGNVGIGKTTPSAKLHVDGTIISEEIKVEDVSGADFVFEQDYDLKSLAEIESFIKSNKHLPEIPSAKEMEENGLELSKMNMMLLQKIEELTLHTIEQQKTIDKLLYRIEKLEKNENK